MINRQLYFLFYPLKCILIKANVFYVLKFKANDYRKAKLEQIFLAGVMF